VREEKKNTKKAPELIKRGRDLTPYSIQPFLITTSGKRQGWKKEKKQNARKGGKAFSLQRRERVLFSNARITHKH